VDLNIHVFVSGHWYRCHVLHLNVSCIFIIIGGTTVNNSTADRDRHVVLQLLRSASFS